MPHNFYFVGLFTGLFVGFLVMLLTMRYFSTKLKEAKAVISLKDAPEAPCQACRDMISALDRSDYCLACDCSCHRRRTRWFEVQRAKVLGG